MIATAIYWSVKRPKRRRNKSLVKYINWPTGGTLFPKWCFVYIFGPAEGP